MRRFLLLAAGLGLLLGTPAAAQDREPAPWAALTSPTAAMHVVFDKVCLAAVMDARSIEERALANHLIEVDARSTGSPTAERAWRLASWSYVYVMALPNGACSASVQAGDAEGMNAAALQDMAARAPFTAGRRDTANGAERTAWCTAEAERPVVAVLLKKVGGRRDAFVANVFRAQDDRPPFCTP
jgi:hypothetical protein